MVGFGEDLRQSSLEVGEILGNYSENFKEESGKENFLTCECAVGGVPIQASSCSYT